MLTPGVCFSVILLSICYTFSVSRALGRQALWLVLVLYWLLARPANVLDYEALALCFFQLFFTKIPFSVNLYFCLLLLGFSGMVNSISFSSNAGCK